MRQQTRFLCLVLLTGSILPGQAIFAQAGSKPLITPDMVRPMVVKLSGDDLEGRGAGYPGERKAAEIIAAEFKTLGLQPSGDGQGKHRSYFQEFKFHPRYPVVPWEMLTSRNVLGMIEGSDPLLKQEIIVVGAHYDGQGRLGQADPFRIYPKNPEAQNHPIWNSANDNATSVAAILATARSIKDGGLKPKRTILFVAFGCEEHGMSGSIQYVTHPAFELSRHVAMINFEKLGRAPEKPLRAQATGTSSSWVEVIQKASSVTGTQVKPLIPYIIPDSDHYPFAESAVPTVVFSVATSDDTHQPTDVAEKIDYEKVAEYARYGLALVLELADRPERLPYTDVRGRDPGLIAHLALDQESDSAGLKAPDSGLKVTGIIPGRPADRAGLKVGDLILVIAGTPIRRDMTLEQLQKMQMQSLMGKQEELPVTIVRGGKQLELTVALGPAMP